MTVNVDLQVNVILDTTGLDRLAQSFEGDVDKALESLAKNTVTIAQKSMAEPKSGKMAGGKSEIRSYLRSKADRGAIQYGKDRFGRARMTWYGNVVRTTAKGTAYAVVGRKLHQTSAPGEPPAVDTGHLTGSGYTKRIGKLAWEAGFSADYALYLEFGTSRMAARPFLFPAVQQAAGDIIVAFRPVFNE
jgi:HK97 gp10 family phage protein